MNDLIPASFVRHDIATPLGNLCVRTGGTGLGLLFWPSLLMSGAMWSAQAAYFMDRYQVVLIDPPGHGDSEPLQRHFTFEECALCVTQILDALGLEQTSFVGNSWGGMIGGTFAALYPQRLRAAVLMNCTASAVGLGQKIEYAALIALVRAFGRIPAPLETTAIRAFTGPTTMRDKPDVIARIRAALTQVNGHSAHWAVESVVPHRPDQRELFHTIHCPVLVVAGAEDRTFPVAETRAMADAHTRMRIRGVEWRSAPSRAGSARCGQRADRSVFAEACITARNAVYARFSRSTSDRLNARKSDPISLLR